MTTPRKEAMEKGKARYQGTPCSKCGGTARYTRNGGCINCVNARSKKWLEKKRKTPVTRKAITYHGAPCKNCGETERYTSNSSCLKCGLAKARERDHERRAILRGKMQPAISTFNRMQLVAFKVKMKAGGFAQLPEGALAIAIFAQAARDVFDNEYSAEAKRFLRGSLVCLQRVGIEPDWVHRLLKDQGVWDIVSTR